MSSPGLKAYIQNFKPQHECDYPTHDLYALILLQVAHEPGNGPAVRADGERKLYGLKPRIGSRHLDGSYLAEYDEQTGQYEVDQSKNEQQFIFGL